MAFSFTQVVWMAIAILFLYIARLWSIAKKVCGTFSCWTSVYIDWLFYKKTYPTTRKLLPLQWPLVQVDSRVTIKAGISQQWCLACTNAHAELFSSNYRKWPRGTSQRVRPQWQICTWKTALQSGNTHRDGTAQWKLAHISWIVVLLSKYAL